MSREKIFNDEKLLLDKSDASIGISISMRDKNDKLISGVFDPIIVKNSGLPCLRSKTYYTLYDNQKATAIKVYKGNNKYVDDNLLIGEFILKDIPKSPAGKQKIELIFSYNCQGILTIMARVHSTGKVIKTNINTLEKDKDIISFEKNIDYDNWEDYDLAYLVKAVIRYGEEIKHDLSSEKAREIDIILKKIKKYLLLNDEEMVKKHKKELIYLLSRVS